MTYYQTRAREALKVLMAYEPGRHADCTIQSISIEGKGRLVVFCGRHGRREIPSWKVDAILKELGYDVEEPEAPIVSRCVG